MNVLNRLSLAAVVLLLSACATNEYAQYPKPTTGSTVVVVPVGSLEAIYASDKGTSFGLIGALVEAAITADSNKEKSKVVTNEMVEAKIEDYLGQQVLSKIAACGVTGKVHKEILVSTDKEWVDSPKSVVPEFAKVKANYVIETGALKLAIRDGILIKSICVGGAAKVFRTTDGLLVNKVPASNFSRTVCPKTALEHYWDGDSEKFNELKAATKSAIDELSTNIALEICSKPQ